MQIFNDVVSWVSFSGGRGVHARSDRFSEKFEECREFEFPVELRMMLIRFLTTILNGLHLFSAPVFRSVAISVPHYNIILVFAALLLVPTGSDIIRHQQTGGRDISSPNRSYQRQELTTGFGESSISFLLS